MSLAPPHSPTGRRGDQSNKELLGLSSNAEHRPSQHWREDLGVSGLSGEIYYYFGSGSGCSGCSGLSFEFVDDYYCYYYSCHDLHDCLFGHALLGLHGRHVAPLLLLVERQLMDLVECGKVGEQQRLLLVGAQRPHLQARLRQRV